MVDRTKNHEEKELSIVDEKLAEIHAGYKTIMSEFKAGKLTEAEYDDKFMSLKAEEAKFDPQKVLEKFEKEALNDSFEIRYLEAERALRNTAKLLNMAHDTWVANRKKNYNGKRITEVSARDIIGLFNAVISSPNATPEQRFTSPMVHYLQRPLTVMEVIRKESTDVMTIDELRAGTLTDATAPFGEGDALPESQYDDARDTRELTYLGHHIKLSDKVRRDSNRRHTIPWFMELLIYFFRLKVEDQVWKGPHSGDNVYGLTTETGIQKIASPLASGAWTRAHVNAFADAIGAIWDSTGVYMPPDYIVLHPVDYMEIIQLGSDQMGWYLSPPLGMPSGAPGGRMVPTLFGVPIVLSHAQTKLTIHLWNAQNSFVVFNGGEINTVNGEIQDQLIKLENTMGVFAVLQQYTRFPKAIYEIKKASG